MQEEYDSFINGLAVPLQKDDNTTEKAIVQSPASFVWRADLFISKNTTAFVERISHLQLHYSNFQGHLNKRKLFKKGCQLGGEERLVSLQPFFVIWFTMTSLFSLIWWDLICKDKFIFI